MGALFNRAPRVQDPPQPDLGLAVQLFTLLALIALAGFIVWTVTDGQAEQELTR